MTLSRDVVFGPYILGRALGSRSGVELVRATYFPPSGRPTLVALRRTRPLHDGAHDRMQAACGRYAILKHADIVPVVDFGTLQARTYICTPLVDGFTLRKVLARCGRLGVGFPTDIALFVIDRTLQALQVAHLQDEPLAHGDLSHTNILLTLAGDVRVADFGLRSVSTRRRSTRGLDVASDRRFVAYMAPEQARGEEATPASDIFVAGVLLHELVTGRPLFAGEQEASVLEPLATGTFHVPLQQQRPDLHPALLRLVHRALAADRRDRFEDVAQFRAAIDALVRQVGVNLSKSFLRSLMNQLFEGGNGVDHPA